MNRLNITAKESSIGHYHIALEGKLDTETYKLLENVLVDIFQSAVKSITLDMEDLTYISSMGLRVIIKATKDLHANRGELIIVHASPSIAAVLDIAKTLPSLNIFASIQEADAYLANIQKTAQ